MKKIFSSICAMSMLLSGCVANAAQQPLAIAYSPYENLSFKELMEQSSKIVREKEDRYKNWFQMDKVCCGCSRSRVANLATSPLVVSLVYAMKDVEEDRLRLEQDRQCAITVCRPSMLFLSALILGTCAVEKCIRIKPNNLTADLDQQLAEINEALKRKVKTD